MSSGSKLAVAAALACGCSFDSTSNGNSGEIAGTTGGTTTAMVTTTSIESTSTSATSGMTGTTNLPTTTSDEMGQASSEVSGEPEEASGEPMVPLQSCREIQIEDPGALTGLYEIAPDGAVLLTPILVHCDMDTDGGGWTLVGRSVEDGTDEGSFGWRSARGDIEDPMHPYSLNVKAAGLKFSQVLVGKQGGGYAWGDRVYRFDVAAGFLDLTNDSVAAAGLTTVFGDCTNPRMLENAGYTGETTVFWFRDQGGFESYGLGHDRFDMYEPTSAILPCDHGGDLHDELGMIMVR